MGSEEAGVVVAEKRRVFEEWLQRRDNVTYSTESCCEQTIKVVKRITDWQCGVRLGNVLVGNKNMFWREVKQERKGEKARRGTRW